MAFGGGATLGEYRARLGIDPSGWTGGLLKANAITSVFGQGVSNFMISPVLGAVGAMSKATGGLVKWGQAALETSEKVERLSGQTGASIELIQALRAEFGLARGKMEEADAAMLAFASRSGDLAIGLGRAVKIAEQYGIELEHLTTFDEKFRAIIDVLDKIEDPTERAAIAAKFFGDTLGTAVVNVVGGSVDALDQMIARQRDLGTVLEDSTITSLARANTQIGTFQQGMRGLLGTLGSEAMSAFFEQFKDLDQEEIQQFFRQMREEWVPAMRDLGREAGETVPDLKEIAEAVGAIARAFNALNDARVGTGEFIGDTAAKAVYELGRGIAPRGRTDPARPDVLPYGPQGYLEENAR